MKSYTNEPLVISIEVPNGNYEVTVSIKAHEDTVFSLLSHARRFIRNDVEIKANESMDITFNANVCDFHKDGADYTEVKTLDVFILCDGAVTATAAVSPVDVPTIYIAGDSTVTDQPAEYPYVPSETFCGWGQALQYQTTRSRARAHLHLSARTSMPSRIKSRRAMFWYASSDTMTRR